MNRINPFFFLFEAGLLLYKKKSNNLPREESSTSLPRGWLKLLRVNILGFLQLHRLYDLFGTLPENRITPTELPMKFFRRKFLTTE